MNNYLIQVTAYCPAPRTLDFRVEASNEATATARAIRRYRGKIGRKKITDWSIKVKKL